MQKVSPIQMAKPERDPAAAAELDRSLAKGITEGTNRLVPDPNDIMAALSRVRRPAITPRPEGWDGRAGERVIAALSTA